MSDYSVLLETQELLDALRETICLLCNLLHIVTNFWTVPSKVHYHGQESVTERIDQSFAL